MNIYFRIFPLFVVLLGIALSSYAEVKKCRKNLTKGTLFTFNINANKTTDPQSSTTTNANEICANAHPLICQETDETEPLPVAAENYITACFNFNPQSFCSTPFAPPKVM